jgi:hypothetical protein
LILGPQQPGGGSQEGAGQQRQAAGNHLTPPPSREPGFLQRGRVRCEVMSPRGHRRFIAVGPRNG